METLSDKKLIIKIIKTIALVKAKIVSSPKTGRVFTTYSKGYIIDPLDERNLKFYGLTEAEFEHLKDTFVNEGFKIERYSFNNVPVTGVTQAELYIRKHIIQ